MLPTRVGGVVDLCCGPGSGIIAALRMGYTAAGLDISQKQLEAAAKKVKLFGHMEVHVCLCSNVVNMTGDQL